MTGRGVLRVRAPATVANLGSGFDCVAFAVDLWNELEVTDGSGVEVVGEDSDRLPRNAEHLGVRAFALLAPPDGHRFVFVNRIPVSRGLGASAAAVALGLTAAAALTHERSQSRLLELGARLEGHSDNVAAALAGGVCATWSDGDRISLRRLAAGTPLDPVAIVPEERLVTSASRRALPATVSHGDAAFNASRALLLGAALAAGDASLLEAGFADRLHEPYRARLSPLLDEVRASLPAGAAGATLAGSGPAVIVWVARDAVVACASELAERFPAARVLSLRVASSGAAAANGA